MDNGHDKGTEEGGLSVGRVLGWIVYLALCGACVFGGYFGGHELTRGMLGRLLPIMLHPKPPLEVFHQDQMNVLILGCDVDRTPGGKIITADHARSDMSMLLHFDFVNNRVSGLSIARDIYYRMPGSRFGGIGHKINAYHEYGGNDLAKKAFEGLLGIKIDRVVQIDFDAFQQMVDRAGGVTVTVDKPLNYDDNAGQLHIHIKPGTQHMNGATAIGFVRYRHGDNDFMRQKRQQQFLMALKSQIIRNPWAFNDVAAIGQRVLGSQFTDDEAISLAGFAKSVDKGNIRFGQTVVTSRPHTTFLYLNRKRTQEVLANLGITPAGASDETVASTKPERAGDGAE